jgi:hypothetical protein
LIHQGILDVGLPRDIWDPCESSIFCLWQQHLPEDMRPASITIYPFTIHMTLHSTGRASRIILKDLLTGLVYLRIETLITYARMGLKMFFCFPLRRCLQKKSGKNVIDEKEKELEQINAECVVREQDQRKERQD